MPSVVDVVQVAAGLAGLLVGAVVEDAMAIIRTILSFRI